MAHESVRFAVIQAWLGQSRRRVVCVGAACAVVTGLVVLAIVLIPRDRGQDVGEYLQVAFFSDEENTAYQRIWSEIYRPSMKRGSISDSDVSSLIASMGRSEPYHIRDSAMAILAQLIHEDIEMSSASRERAIQSFLDMLQDEDWRLRRVTVTHVQTVRLLHDQRVYDVVRGMSDDHRREVANRVNRIDWTDPKNRP